MKPILQLQEIANVDFSSMTYNDLRSVMESISQITTKVEPLMVEKELDNLTRQYVETMLSYGVAGDEILHRVESLLPKNNDPDPVEVIPEVESTKEEPVSVEPTKENGEEDIFDNPGFKVVFNPLGIEIPTTPVPEPETILEPETIQEPESEPEERLQTLEELLSDDPRYQVKEQSLKKKQLLSMDELLTDDPINKIITMGYAKNSSYKQNDRIFHADGIIGTQTASGRTYVYIP